MRLFLDTADRAAAEDLLSTGLFAGLTTNPTILERAGLGSADIPAVHDWARTAGAGEIFFQAWGTDPRTLAARGRQLRALGEDVTVKLVASRAGAAACAELSADGIPTLLTAVYAPGQALVAAAARARYIAPYLGKLDEAGRDGLAEVLAMHEALTATGSATRVLAASIRDLSSVVALARAGVDCFTLGPTVAEALFTEELTARAVDVFELAAGSSQDAVPA